MGYYRGMNKTALWGLLAIIIIAAGAAYYYQRHMPASTTGQEASLANPASVNCVKTLHGQLPFARRTQLRRVGAL